MDHIIKVACKDVVYYVGNTFLAVMLAEPGVTDVICEVACINHSFFLAVGQNFSSDRLMDAFLGELASLDIGYEVTGREPLRLCGFEAFGVRS